LTRKLVTVNNPDKIIFVGEALVGNEAVDQLTKFDRSLKDFSSAGTGGGQRKRGIDGIILTKFDTIVSYMFRSKISLTSRMTRLALHCL
jgi:signal recognition particle receptor subunit alpha